jgi:hypothetical protein
MRRSAGMASPDESEEAALGRRAADRPSLVDSAALMRSRLGAVTDPKAECGQQFSFRLAIFEIDVKNLVIDELSR